MLDEQDVYKYDNNKKCLYDFRSENQTHESFGKSLEKMRSLDL